MAYLSSFRRIKGGIDLLLTKKQVTNNCNYLEFNLNTNYTRCLKINDDVLLTQDNFKLTLK